MTVFYTAVLVGSAIAAWLSLTVIVPASLRSVFRYKLWEIRDNLVDDIQADRFVEPAQLDLLQRHVECMIAFAPEVTPFRMGAFRMIAGSSLQQTEVRMFDLSQVHPKDRDLARAYEARIKSALTRHLFFGSPSGWLLFFVVVPMAFLFALSRYIIRRPGQDVVSVRVVVKGKARASVEPERELALLAGRRDRDDKLSLCM